MIGQFVICPIIILLLNEGSGEGDFWKTLFILNTG